METRICPHYCPPGASPCVAPGSHPSDLGVAGSNNIEKLKYLFDWLFSHSFSHDIPAANTALLHSSFSLSKIMQSQKPKFVLVLSRKAMWMSNPQKDSLHIKTAFEVLSSYLLCNYPDNKGHSVCHPFPRSHIAMPAGSFIGHSPLTQ